MFIAVKPEIGIDIRGAAWYYTCRKQPHICLRGGVKVPTGGIVRELLRQQEPAQFRYRQYSLDERRRVWHFAMLFFDACTLEGNFRVFVIEKEYIL